MDWLPGAIRRPMHETGFPWQVNCPPKICWHTTEGFGVPNYPSQYEPHLTVVADPGKDVQAYQHIAFDRAAYALKHASGRAPTNGAHAIQIELAGTCDPSGPNGAYFWPDADDAVLRALWAKVAKPLSDGLGVKLVAPAWKAYPGSYGANGVRFSDQTWLAWNGHCGHQHVPGNDHGDPGAFPWGRLMQLAQGQETDVPLTDDDAALVARAVHNQLLFGSDVSIGKAVYDTYRRPAPVTPAIPTAADIAAIVVAQFKTLPAGTATLADADVARIAKAAVDELNTRLVR